LLEALERVLKGTPLETLVKDLFQVGMMGREGGRERGESEAACSCCPGGQEGEGEGEEDDDDEREDFRFETGTHRPSSSSFSFFLSVRGDRAP